MVVGICRRRGLSSVVCQRICNVTHQGAARDGGPVVLRPVRATPCLLRVAAVCCFTQSRL